MRQFHRSLLLQRLAQLQAVQQADADAQRALLADLMPSAAAAVAAPIGLPADVADADDTWEDIDDDQLLSELTSIGALAAAASYSPLLVSAADMDALPLAARGDESGPWEVRDADDDAARLAADRRTVLATMARRADSWAGAANSAASATGLPRAPARPAQPAGIEDKMWRAEVFDGVVCACVCVCVCVRMSTGSVGPYHVCILVLSPGMGARDVRIRRAAAWRRANRVSPSRCHCPSSRS